MKRTLSVVLVLLLILAPCAMAETALRTVTHVLPRTVEALEDSPFHVAEVMGYMKEQGLTLKLVEAFGSTDIKMVATGQAEFCAPGPMYILSAIAEDLPVKVVMAYDAINIWGMAVLNDSPLKTFDDMKGAVEKYGKKLTVALGDASWEMLVTPTLVAAGVDVKNDLEFVVAGENRYVQVAEGNIDMLFTWPGECWQLIGQNYDFRYIDGNDVLQTNSNAIVSSNKLIAEEPQVVQGYVTALCKATYFVHYNPEAAAAVMANEFPNIDVSWKAAKYIQQGRIYQMFGAAGSESEAKILENIGFNWEDTWALNVKVALETGMIDKELTAADIFTNEFIKSDWDKAQVEKDADSVDIATVSARYAAE